MSCWCDLCRAILRQDSLYPTSSLHRKLLMECCDPRRMFAVTKENSPMGKVLWYDGEFYHSHTVNNETYSLFVQVRRKSLTKEQHLHASVIPLLCDGRFFPPQGATRLLFHHMTLRNWPLCSWEAAQTRRWKVLFRPTRRNSTLLWRLCGILCGSFAGPWRRRGGGQRRRQCSAVRGESVLRCDIRATRHLLRDAANISCKDKRHDTVLFHLKIYVTIGPIHLSFYRNRI